MTEAAGGASVAPRRRLWLLLSLAVVAVAVGLWLLRAPAARIAQRPQAARRSVAVLSLADVSGRPDDAWLATALAELLTAELAAGDGLRAVSGDNVARVRAELSLPQADTLPVATLSRVAQILDADLLLLGSYAAGGGGELHLELRLQDATGAERARFASDGGEAALSELVALAGARIRQALGVPVAPAGVHPSRMTAPANVAATRLYAEGLTQLRRFDGLAARDTLERAVAADPLSPLLHSALAAAWTTLGYDAKVREEAKKAFDLSEGLPREHKLLVEGRYRDAARERDKAVACYQALASAYPDDVEYGLLLSEALTSAGKGKEALASLETLRTLHAGASEDPRVDVAESVAALSLSDLARARDSAVRAAQRASELGARLLEARSRAQLALALWQKGDYREAVEASEQANRVFAAVGDRRGVARSLNFTGLVLSDQGELPRAKASFDAALAVNREIGSMTGVSSVLNNLATLLELEGDLAGARRNYEQALGIARELGDKRAVAGRLTNIGQVLHGLGDVAAASRTLAEALATAREIGSRRQVWIALAVQAAVLRQRVNLAAAKANCDEAGAIAREIGDRSGTANVTQCLADLSFTAGELEPARTQYEAARALFVELGQKGETAGVDLALARLALEQQRAAQAETLAAAAVSEFAKERRPNDEALAQTVLASAQRAQGKLPPAQQALARATALGAHSQALETRLRVAIAAAQGGAAAEPAVRSLQASLAEAREAGFFATQLEIALALGQLELATRPEAGRARLQALARQADAKGFGLVARKARAAVE